MLVKTAPVQIKEVGTGDDEGTFEAIVSAFGNVDSYGDIVMPGAFADSLKEWADSGDPIPVLFAHNSYDPDYNVGWVLEAKETDEGLWIKARLDVESEVGKARQVHRLLKGRRVKQFSFAYDVLDGRWAKQDEVDVYELHKLKLYEVGPCLIGANQETRLLGAKSDEHAALAAVRAMTALAAEVKAGRVLSAANETRIRTAQEELASVLAALDTEDDDSKSSTSQTSEGDTAPGNPDSGKAPAGEPAKDEEPDGAKSEEPMRRSPAATAADESTRLLLDIEALDAGL